MNTTQIQEQIAPLEERRAALVQQRSEQSNAVQVAHDAFVKGEGTPRDVSLAKSDLDVLNSAVADLDIQLENKRGEFNQVKFEENEKRKIARGLELVSEAQAVLGDHDAAYREACDELLPRIERMVGARKKLGEMREELNALGVSLPCPRADLEAINTDWSRYRFGENASPAADYGVQQGFWSYCNYQEHRTVAIPDALARNSYPQSFEFEPVSGPPRGVKSEAVGPTRMDESDIGQIGRSGI